VRVREDMRHHVSLPYQKYGYHGYHWYKLQWRLFFTLAHCTKIKLFIAHEFVMSNHKTHQS